MRKELISYCEADVKYTLALYQELYPEGVLILKIGKRVRIKFVRYWYVRAHRWYFNRTYTNGRRRICVPFLTIDIYPKGYWDR